jgi:hypothetical protein
MPRTAIGAFYAMMRASYWKRASRNSASTRPAETDDARHFPRMPTRWSLGPKVAQTGGPTMGRACPLCPGISDVNLFRYCEGIVYLNAKISDRAFDLGVPKQKLDGPEIARTSVDQGSLCTSQRMRPEQPWVQRPMLPIHSETRRAYWRVVTLHSAPPRLVNKKSPGLLFESFK